jgi:hypothetical protein
LLLFILCCSLIASYAQEEMQTDSAKNRFDPQLLAPVYEQLQPSGTPIFPDFFTVPNLSIFRQPLLPEYNKNLDFSKFLSPSQNRFTFRQEEFSTFLSSGRVFNQSSIHLNDKFLVGGNSFGARSIFEQPKLNPSMNDFSVKGASMFMQYKVSDKFKVQTRISISNGHAPPGMVW